MIKKIAIGAISFIFACIGAYVYVVLKHARQDESNAIYEVAEKLPFEPYLIKKEGQKSESAMEVIQKVEEEKKAQSENEPLVIFKTPQESQKQEKKAQDISLQEQIAKLQKENAELKKQKEPKKTFSFENVFGKEEDKVSKDNEIDPITKKRIASKVGITQEQEKKKTKMVIDYGVDSIKGEQGFKATNENKLYRTILSMDRIPVIITQKIKSTLGGSIVGQVRDNVYSYMGRAVLIPKGSKIEGEYLSNNKAGEDRIQIAWKRIVTPNGVNIRFVAKTLDMEGASGAVGEVDNRYWERYGLPLTITTSTNLGMLAVSNLTQKIPSVQSQDILNQGASDVSNIGKAILSEQIKINPIITIEAGDIVFVSPKKDLYFPKPKDGEILAEYFDRLEEQQLQGE